MEQIASIVAPVATTIAAFIVASNFGARVTGYGFVIFTVGSIAWTALGYATDQPSLLWQNVLLTALNLFGIWRWLGRQSRIEDGAMAAAEASEHRPGEPLFPVSLLTKGRIVDGRGEEIGACVDAMAGCRSGRIRYVVATEGGVAGMGETLRRLPWEQARIEADELQTSLDSSRFCGLPSIAKDDWPDK
jgi:hypothetical protein